LQAENQTREFKSKWQNCLLHLVAFVSTCTSPIWISIMKQVNSVAGYQISTKVGKLNISLFSSVSRITVPNPTKLYHQFSYLLWYEGVWRVFK
jgi:hypothetical protein